MYLVSRWRKTGREEDDWTFNGREFQMTKTTTGKERQQTIDRRNECVGFNVPLDT